jgi:hypothetical protein
MTVKLGERYRDGISGYEGVATSRIEYLYGCVRVVLEAGVQGKPEEFVFDEQRLVEVATEEPPTPTARAGGSRPTPPRTGLK